METKGEFLDESTPLCYSDYVKVEYPAILKDVASVSHAIFGNFFSKFVY